MIQKLLLAIGFISAINAKPFLSPESAYGTDASKLECEQGNPSACVQVSLKYGKESGYIFIKSFSYSSQAQKYMEKACDYGNKKACKVVKVAIEQKSLNEACDSGKRQACIDLKKTYHLINGECSACGSMHIGHYAYGRIKPNRKMQAKIDKGEIILGGCIVSKDNPASFCLDCGADLYDKKDDE